MKIFPSLLWKSLPGFSRMNSAATRAVVVALAGALIGSSSLLAATATTVTMTITSAGSPVTSVAQGSVVVLTASVAAGSTSVKVGQVNFCDASAQYCTDIHLLATVQITGAGTATYKFRPGPGSHSYKAVFVGTTTYAANSSAASALSVTAPAKFPTATSIVQSGTNGNYSLTAVVGGNGSTAPTGILSFLDTTNGNSTITSAALGSGTGFGFLNTLNLPVGMAAIAVGDFNGDGILDLIVGTSTITALAAPPGYMTVLLGNPDGTFTVTSGNPMTGIDPYSAVVGDFNGDGNQDVAITNAGGITATILLGNGDGTFTPTSVNPGTSQDPVSIVSADFNRDGILDLAVANSESNAVTILLGNGDGTFIPALVSPPTGPNPDSITVGDFNGDGIADLATANVTSNSVTVLLGNGDGTFTSAANLQAGSVPNSIIAGDFNQDGKLDLAVADNNSSGNGSVMILLGNGNGTFNATSENLATGIDPDFITIGDFNGDHIPDLAITNGISNTVTILLGEGDGTFTLATSNPATNGFNPQSTAVGDFNGDGLSDLAVGSAGSYNGGTVYGGFGVTVFQAADQIATATATGITVDGGPHFVSANYPGDGNYAPSVSATTNLAGPIVTTTLTLTASPNGNIPSGQVVTLTATLSPSTTQSHSADGETVTFYNGTTVLGTGTLSGGQATLTFNPLPNPYSVTANYAGDAYLSQSVSSAQSLNVGPAIPTTLSLGASPTYTPLYGQNVTITAYLTPYSSQGHSTDGETVTFYNGTTVLGTSTLSGGQASISVAPTSTSPESITAQFTEDLYFSSSSAGPIYIAAATPISTALMVNISPSSVTYGSPVTLTASLNPFTNQGQSSNGGEVTFINANNSTYIGTASLLNGVATFTSYNLQPGAYQVQANYDGNVYFGPSGNQVPVLLTVNQSKPTLTVTSSVNPASVSAPVTFTVTMTNYVFGRVLPIPYVALMDGNTALDAVNVGGSLTFTTSALTAGTHTITAVFGGDTYNASATSAPLMEVIQNALPAPSITLTSSANPASSGAPVTFTATLANYSGGSQQESVGFYDGATQIGTGPIAAGLNTATYTTSSLATGSHTITAQYVGVDTNIAVKSAPLTETIEDLSIGSSTGGSISPQTASPGGDATYTFVVSPPSDATFPAPVTFAVTGLPTGATAVFSPATLPANSGPATVTMTVTLPSQSAMNPSQRLNFGRTLPMALGLILLPFLSGRRKRRLWNRAFCILVLGFVGLGGLTACGGGNSSGNSGNGSNPTSQTYTLTITATSGTLTHSASTSLTVD